MGMRPTSNQVFFLARCSIISLIFNTLFQLRPVVGEPQALSMRSGLSLDRAESPARWRRTSERQNPRRFHKSQACSSYFSPGLVQAGDILARYPDEPASPISTDEVKNLLSARFAPRNFGPPFKAIDFARKIRPFSPRFATCAPIHGLSSLGLSSLAALCL